jgi:metal-dependent amidase/aminoacylase/carboxypeptidase family protein
MHPNTSELEELDKDVHRHPELPMPERRTAGRAVERLSTAGFEATAGVGGTGVVGLLGNGEGPTVMLRADMHALPVAAQTGLEYASMVDGVPHACGHDTHVTPVAAASTRLAA